LILALKQTPKSKGDAPSIIAEQNMEQIVKKKFIVNVTHLSIKLPLFLEQAGLQRDRWQAIVGT